MTILPISRSGKLSSNKGLGTTHTSNSSNKYHVIHNAAFTLPSEVHHTRQSPVNFCVFPNGLLLFYLSNIKAN